jgi:hypothetical protein
MYFFFYATKIEMNSLDVPPAWAYSWCYYFLAAAAIPIISAIVLIVSGGNKLGLTTILMFVVAALIQAATFLTMFWMCRSSLRPSA